MEDVRSLLRISTLRQAEFSLEEISRMMHDAQAARRIITLHMQRLSEREARTVKLLKNMEKLCRQPDIDFETFADALVNSVG